MSNPSQLFLLADHIKLSLLERQRAISLNLEPNTQDSHISRSLETLQEGVENLEQQDSQDPSIRDQTSRIRTQLDDLTSQFHGFPATNTTKASLNQPNDPSLASDFTHARESRPRNAASSSLLKRSGANATAASPKSVRFSDSPAAQQPNDAEEADRAALFPYRDDPDEAPDQSGLDNQQIHEYHSQVLAEQDEQLDRLGESIGRQRELSIQIGDELDDHVQLLDDVDEQVDRHQSRLDGARNRLGKVARRAKDNKQLTVIFVLIVILVLLIIILK